MFYFLSRLLAAIVPVTIFYSLSLTAVRSNELADRINPSSKATEIDPGHWSFRSFQSLVKRYDCLSESAEATFDGISQIERSKFAKDINSCTEQMQELVGIAPADLEILKQLQTEFATELTALKGKIERLDTDVSKLETQQFSTTTKLTGQAIFAINAGTFGGDRIIAPRGAIVSRSQPNATSLYRVSLDLNTSFSGKDLLKVRLVSASTGSGDNAAGFLEPNFGSVLDFADLFTKNDLAGIGIAQPFLLKEVGNATQTNFEAFYNIPVSQSLSITPIVQVITNPANQSSNSSIVTGTIRGVFSF